MQISSPVKKMLWWFFIALIIFVSRLPSYYGGFVNIDENEYAIAAMKILSGGLPYRDFLIYQPPVIYYFYALGFWLFGAQNLHGVHFLLQIVVFLSCLLIYLAGKKVFSEKAGFFGALFYAVISAIGLPQDMLAANCEILAVLPALLAVWLYFGEFFFLSGCAASFAFLTKYQCGIVLVPLIFSALFKKKNFSSFVNIIIGFIVPVISVLFILRNYAVAKEALEAFIYITLYAKGPVQANVPYVALKFAVRTFLVALAEMFFWCYLIKGLISGIKERAFFLVWFLAGFIPVILGGRMYFHYYFTVFPIVAIIAGAGFERYRLQKTLKNVLIGWTIFMASGFFVYGLYKPHRKLTVKDDWIYVVDYLKNNKEQGDTLFVWGYCPQMYISSGLPAATRFTTADYLTGRMPMTAGLEYDPNAPDPPSVWRKVMTDFFSANDVVVFDTSKNIFPKAWDILKEDFQERLPTYIVDTVPSNYRRYGRYPIEKYPYLKDVIAKNYLLATEIKGYKIYKHQ